jgi:hypothetical protein
MELEALMGALNQSVDILAQLINLIVLEAEFEEWDVKLYKIIEKIKCKSEEVYSSLIKIVTIVFCMSVLSAIQQNTLN